MIDNVIYTLLSTDTDVSALVGDRINPNFAPGEPEVYPYITFKLEEREPTDTKDGKSCLDLLLYEIEIWTKKPADSKDLGIKVQNVLDRFTGTVDGDEIQSSKMMGNETGYTDTNRVYLTVQMYVFRHLTIYGILQAATNLTATGVSSSQINLAWTDNATGETGYEVWSSTDCINWTLITTTAANATSYNDTGLAADTPFAYRVRPIDATNQSSWSNIDIGSTFSAAASPSGIAYDRPQLSGQLTSYGTGDDADNLANGVYDYTPPIFPVSFAELDTTDIAPFLTLLSNNTFSNTDRFTDSAGNQNYDGTGGSINNYLIDHLTGLGWYLVQQSGSNWSTELANANSSTVATFSDWRMANRPEQSSVLDHELTSVLNYAPFSNILNNFARTSTTMASGTSSAYRVNSSSVFGSGAKTNTSNANFLVRNHFS